MLDQKILSLKERYQNGRDNIGRDLVQVCMSECILYRRGTGFFSSSALKSYIDVIDRVINENVKIEILCSPIIQDAAVINALENNLTEEDRVRNIIRFSEDMVLASVGLKSHPYSTDYRSKLLSYLIAVEKLEIRFAIPKDFRQLYIGNSIDNERNIYHVKDGYFLFPDGEVVAFDGSFNESDSGLQHHIDRVQVYRSWIPEDQRRMKGITDDVDTDWEKRNSYLSVYELSDKTIELVKRHSPQRDPRNNKMNGVKKISVSTIGSKTKNIKRLWPHQVKAIQKFLDKECGVLEMATGTGKTTTALEISRRLIERDCISSVVVVTYGNDLLDQWYKAINNWKAEHPELASTSVYRSYGGHRELLNFTSSKGNTVLILGRSAANFKRLFSNSQINRSRLLIIHDEIHGYGSKSLVDSLSGKHEGIRFRLGLSATPEREYDAVGTKFIEEEIGKVIFEYPTEDAISDGILCEFDYVPLPFTLTENDRAERKKVYARQAIAQKEGKSWDKETLYRELSKVIKKAVLKPSVLEDFLHHNRNSIVNSIIYTLDSAQGDSIASVVSKFTHDYRTYYQGTDSKYLDMLGSGKIDTVIANERLNEGIDIPSLKTVFLVSSDRARLKTIQRIGRCLRIDPENPTKRALVVDFVVEEDKGEDDYLGADSIRSRWLAELSKVRCRSKKKEANED